MKIRDKLLLYTLAPVLMAFAAILWLSSMSGRSMLTSEIKHRAENMLSAHVWELTTRLQAVEGVAQGLALAVGSLKPVQEDSVKALIRNALDEESLVYGSTISFEPRSFLNGVDLFGPYYHRSPEGLEYVDLAAPSYDYIKWEWYTKTRDAGKSLWSEPYVDVGGGNVAMVTYSRPFFRGREFWGVATADVALSDLTSSIDGIHTGMTGFAFLLSQNGAFLTMRDKDWKLSRTIFDYANEKKNPELADIGKRMVAGESGYEPVFDEGSGQLLWVAFQPIPATHWSMGIVFPEKELLADLSELRLRMMALGGIGIVAITLLIIVVSSRMSRPIHLLAESAQRISAGDLRTPPSGTGGNDEIGMLANSFSGMQKSLTATLSELRSEKELFQTSFAHMSDGLAIMDANGNAIKFNDAAEKLLDLPAPGPLLPHIAADFESSIPYAAIHAAPAKPMHFTLTRRESETQGALSLDAILVPILDDSGAIKLSVINLRDVTSYEAEERTKRNFLSLISHKLRTPVSVLQSSLAMMRDGLLGGLSDKQQRHSASMFNQASKLMGLIEKLIGFVTIEGAELENAKERIDLAALLDDLSTETRDMYVEKHPEISVEIADDAKEIDFNKAYLRLAIGQLLDNALKFNMSDPAHVAVKISHAAGRIAISVADDGVGIPPEYLDRIFDKFFQIEKYFTGNVEGVGLGLAYVRHIVTHFGGTVEVKSKPGEGSTFTMTLPAAAHQAGQTV